MANCRRQIQEEASHAPRRSVMRQLSRSQLTSFCPRLLILSNLLPLALSRFALILLRVHLPWSQTINLWMSCNMRASTSTHMVCATSQFPRGGFLECTQLFSYQNRSWAIFRRSPTPSPSASPLTCHWHTAAAVLNPPPSLFCFSIRAPVPRRDSDCFRTQCGSPNAATFRCSR